MFIVLTEHIYKFLLPFTEATKWGDALNEKEMAASGHDGPPEQTKDPPVRRYCEVLHTKILTGKPIQQPVFL
jgi:hypothetical protein